MNDRTPYTIEASTEGPCPCDQATIRLRRVIGTTEWDDLRREVAGLLGQGVKHLKLDLIDIEQVNLFNSVEIAHWVVLHHEVHDGGGRLQFHFPPDSVLRQTLSRYQLDRLLALSFADRPA